MLQMSRLQKGGGGGGGGSQQLLHWITEITTKIAQTKYCEEIILFHCWKIIPFFRLKHEMLPKFFLK